MAWLGLLDFQRAASARYLYANGTARRATTLMMKARANGYAPSHVGASPPRTWRQFCACAVSASFGCKRLSIGGRERWQSLERRTATSRHAR